ncbi:NADH-quinone oxidoreductase subunit L [Granulicella sibirica]|uniref:NADH-ubiquinone oxidoreductase chain L n=1 Tax=Granulicella sibirica TaxID=2479048 RepID=A0A4Q0T3V6_9BACT|nr:NADH-quinone oxidoreductase subunit L [Granulicella sibirica]RXH56241.1 NADH-ubiquinone oxidoreductase chain L [Granulicella sibirica]
MNPNSLWLIPLSPFLGFLINGTVGRRLPRPLVTAIALFFTAVPMLLVLQLWIFMKAAGAPEAIHVLCGPWIQITGFTVPFGIAVDHLSLIMLAIVTGVGFLIHLYSAGYMAHEEGYWRFFAYLNLFMFFMSILVLAESFLLLFVGWEGVGLASYLLIGFYFTKDSAANAGKKAFIVNRIGDFGFLLGMFLLVAHFGSLSFNEVFASIATHPEYQGGFLTAIALCLVVGATGKSAQIPLYVWLPDAMEGPTPVSALIHAATMVTAGIYMVARCHVLFDRSPFALGVVAIIGAATAIFAACIGMVQHDIKRVLAYSTVSQLGYMFLACGVAAYSAGIFHLMTHAFFKALLFLSAGSVIHALSGEQDMRKMGGLRKRIPVTFWTMTMGVFAIAGIPPLAGFFSKDEILYQTFVSPNPIGKLLWLVGLATAGMTSFYMFRLWFKTFFGPERFDEHPAPADHAHKDAHDDAQAAHAHGVHESPWIMLTPLVLLAILSIIGGWVGVPAALGGHDEIGHFLDPVFVAPLVVAVDGEKAGHGLELGLAAVSVAVALLGFFVAYVFYYKRPGTLGKLAATSKLYPIVANKFYIDEIYNVVIVTPLLAFARLILEVLVDGGLVNGSGKLAGLTTIGLSNVTRKMQSGNIRSYAGWLAFGAACVIAVMIFARF